MLKWKLHKKEESDVKCIPQQCFVCHEICMIPEGEYEICTDCYFSLCSDMERETGEDVK